MTIQNQVFVGNTTMSDVIVSQFSLFLSFLPYILGLFFLIWLMQYVLYTPLTEEEKEQKKEEERKEEIYDGCVDIMEEQRWENMSVGEWRKLQYEAGIEEKEKLKDIQSSASLGATLGVINLFH